MRRNLPADEARWRAYLTDDEPPEVEFCPTCAEQDDDPVLIVESESAP